MKKLILATAVALALAGCASSIPEVSRYDGQTMTMQIRATQQHWELIIDGQVVANHPVVTWQSAINMNGVYKGKPVMARMYYRSNGWSAVYVADVFIEGQLVETLTIQ